MTGFPISLLVLRQKENIGINRINKFKPPSLNKDNKKKTKLVAALSRKRIVNMIIIVMVSYESAHKWINEMHVSDTY